MTGSLWYCTCRPFANKVVERLAQGHHRGVVHSLPQLLDGALRCLFVNADVAALARGLLENLGFQLRLHLLDAFGCDSRSRDRDRWALLVADDVRAPVNIDQRFLSQVDPYDIPVVHFEYLVQNRANAGEMGLRHTSDVELGDHAEIGRT